MDEMLRQILTFHSRIVEAEAMAAGVPAVAGQLHADDPGRFPAPTREWAQWLYGEHSPGHRQGVLREFASDCLPREQGRGVEAAVRVLASVKILGEGVDTARCDAVAFTDTRGSMVDIVQPEMLTSAAYSSLSKLLSALRAHAPGNVEALADPRARSGSWISDDGLDEAASVTGGASTLPGAWRSVRSALLGAWRGWC
ncbi:hypothetical protein ABT127_30520 [Streptomyces sp. NPDC001904]|uniref:hypothetical protein n=1 Tax=Streptomyces sp. NPDC001904 TaxID=3154531 RepID=UPI003330D3CB